MNSKMTTNSQLSTTKSRKQTKINKLSKQLKLEQNHKCGDFMEGYQQGVGSGRMWEKVQGLRSIIGRYKIDRRVLRVV